MIELKISKKNAQRESLLQVKLEGRLQKQKQLENSIVDEIANLQNLLAGNVDESSGGTPGIPIDGGLSFLLLGGLGFGAYKMKKAKS